jgi:putative ABC transport system substrate-binding protein
MGFDYYQHGRQTGAMARKILAGTKPSALPVEYQQEQQLHINLKAAEAMGAPPPQQLIDRAAKLYR